VEALTVLATENPERSAGSWLRILVRCQLDSWCHDRDLTVAELVERARELSDEGRWIPDARSGSDH
jgi:hypothetical protein